MIDLCVGGVAAACWWVARALNLRVWPTAGSTPMEVFTALLLVTSTLIELSADFPAAVLWQLVAGLSG